MGMRGASAKGAWTRRVQPHGRGGARGGPNSMPEEAPPPPPPRPGPPTVRHAHAALTSTSGHRSSGMAANQGPPALRGRGAQQQQGGGGCAVHCGAEGAPPGRTRRLRGHVRRLASWARRRT